MVRPKNPTLVLEKTQISVQRCHRQGHNNLIHMRLALSEQQSEFRGSLLELNKDSDCHQQFAIT